MLHIKRRTTAKERERREREEGLQAAKLEWWSHNKPCESKDPDTRQGGIGLCIELAGI